MHHNVVALYPVLEARVPIEPNGVCLAALNQGFRKAKANYQVAKYATIVIIVVALNSATQLFKSQDDGINIPVELSLIAGIALNTKIAVAWQWH